ncbi:MAG: WYL domain-containing protein, partial [Myxococcota bacterium]|nr:WYL domain-containing protein [Myxococcota bacterium]
LNKSQKFVRILEALQSHGGVSAQDLMTRFSLDDRTLRRYLADLKALDLPVRSEGRGADRRLSLDPSYRRQGVQLNLLELVSLRFGRSLFDFLEGTGFAADMDDALDTLSALAVLGGREQLAQHLDRKFVAVPEHRKDHTGDADLLDEVLSALLYQNPSLAHYAKVAGPTKRYSLQPYTLAVYRHGLYLIAMDVDQQRIKTFAIDRFRHFERQRGEHFDYPEDYRPDTLYRDAFGIIGGGTPIAVALRFNRRVSPYIRERIWHHTQQVEPTGDGGVTLCMRVAMGPELVQWIMGFGPDVRVEGPGELADRVRRLHREAAEGWSDLASAGRTAS